MTKSSGISSERIDQGWRQDAGDVSGGTAAKKVEKRRAGTAEVDPQAVPLGQVDHLPASRAALSAHPSQLGTFYGEASVIARATAAAILGAIRGLPKVDANHVVPDIGEKVDPARHLAQPWRLHSLAPDFKLLDVWAMPIVADPAKGETFHKFLELALENGLSSNSSVERFFTWLRGEMGDAFAWEFKPGEGTVAGTKEHSLIERLTAEDRKVDRRTGGPTVENPITKLQMVYERENEALFEIHNKTVSALFHLSFVPTPDGKKMTPELAVYTKNRDFKSTLYLGLIEPFRLVAVYPQWIATMAEKWQAATAGDQAPAKS